ncbi:hypothetical protein F5B22DRAFT_208078 [Xylaria bambusicola]|uniref:uncharacterized protein n=1 Tax=Xylaria bambusicola TaxID=326684 RepID=UPI002008D48E|nr:uncharacterized protein F5B22DRAFT_208078 [Xylaria bambusicola]KAI0514910.1 hypothetical protein F5B22DRAFT_208078 [Xylaria bambusicola]
MGYIEKVMYSMRVTYSRWRVRCFRRRNQAVINNTVGQNHPANAEGLNLRQWDSLEGKQYVDAAYFNPFQTESFQSERITRALAKAQDDKLLLPNSELASPPKAELNPIIATMNGTVYNSDHSPEMIIALAMAGITHWDDSALTPAPKAGSDPNPEPGVGEQAPGSIHSSGAIKSKLNPRVPCFQPRNYVQPQSACTYQHTDTLSRSMIIVGDGLYGPISKATVPAISTRSESRFFPKIGHACLRHQDTSTASANSEHRTASKDSLPPRVHGTRRSEPTYKGKRMTPKVKLLPRVNGDCPSEPTYTEAALTASTTWEYRVVLEDSLPPHVNGIAQVNHFTRKNWRPLRSKFHLLQ